MSTAIANATTPAADAPNATSQSLTNLTNNFGSFLQLLTTQLQNQDPLSPMETHEFTNQLVMFAEAEQAIATNKKLDSLIAIEQKNEASQALSYYGKEVRVKGNKLSFHGDPVTFQYTMPENSVSGILVVRNEEGKEVLTKPLDATQMTEGLHQLSWDGRNDYGYQLSKGLYTVSISAKNGLGEDVKVADMSVTASVKGVEYEDGKTWLDMGYYQVTLDNIASITTPGFQVEDQVRAMNFVGSNVHITGSIAPVKDGKLDLVYNTSGVGDFSKALESEEMNLDTVKLKFYDQSGHLAYYEDVTEQIDIARLEGGEKRINMSIPELHDNDYRVEMEVKFVRPETEEESGTDTESDSTSDTEEEKIVKYAVPMGYAGKVRRVVFDQGRALLEINGVLYNPNDVGAVLDGNTPIIKL